MAQDSNRRYNYVVKFLNNTNMTSYVAEYEGLLDALMVAKDTDIYCQPMISEEQFNEELITLLTSGQIKVKHRGEETVVMLTKRDLSTDVETPVYDGTIVPFVAGATGIITSNKIPAARDYKNDEQRKEANSPVAKTQDNKHSEMYTIMRVVPPVAKD